MERIIDITTILGADLKSRYAVNDLLLFIKNTECTHVAVDFAHVKFATRSFIDEYYNIIMNNPSLTIQIDTINIPEDIQFIFNAVKRTQFKEKDIQLDASIIECDTYEDIKQVFSALAF
jgi:hypothetical protein